MRVHILGICGTFMGSLAILAKNKGFTVTGSDENVYPPMSTLLREQGIEIFSGHSVKHLEPMPDYIVVGNVMKRGIPIIEHILDNNIPCYSGPQFLRETILHDKYVLAVSGTHGKTTTTSMLAWVLHKAKKDPGFLIGGVPNNFDVSAKLGGGKYFVIEADEYDSAFFDKRSKFIHYKPNTLIINNIEFDHADIFESLSDIKKQFNHLLKIVPSTGTVVHRHTDQNIQDVLKQGIWSKSKSFDLTSGDLNLKSVPNLKLQVLGEHNKLNALACIAAAESIGIPVVDSIKYLQEFTGVKRRLELVGVTKGVTILDDFAHHPTAIKETINAVKTRYFASKVPFANDSSNSKRLIAIVDICSNTMRMGHHQETLFNSLQDVDVIYFFHNKPLNWDINNALKINNSNKDKNGSSINSKVIGVYSKTDDILSNLLKTVTSGDVVLFLSNGSCGGLQNDLLKQHSA